MFGELRFEVSCVVESLKVVVVSGSFILKSSSSVFGYILVFY